MMKCSSFVKRHSNLKTLKEFSGICGIKVRTLQNWYVKNQSAFLCIMVGAMCEKDSIENPKEWNGGDS